MQQPELQVGKFSLRQIITIALLFMMSGTVLELYLLDHYEGPLQLIPILCIGISFVLALLLLFRKTRILVRIFQILMALTALSGIYGAILHLKANYEFEQEMKPTTESWDLFVESLSGALPALAPFSLIVLALIGYSYIILLKQKQ